MELNFGINLISFCFIVCVKNFFVMVLIIFFVWEGVNIWLYSLFSSFIKEIWSVVNIGIVVKGRGIVVRVVVMIEKVKIYWWVIFW